MFVETVGDGTKKLEWSLGYGGLRRGGERFFTRGVEMEVADAQATGPVFHFSEAPTVTTGFIAFVFDIRRDRSRAGLDLRG